MLLSYDSIRLFLHVCVFPGGVVLPLPAAVTALLQPVGFPSLGSLLLQDLCVIQNLQTWDLTDDVLSAEEQMNRKMKNTICRTLCAG